MAKRLTAAWLTPDAYSKSQVWGTDWLSFNGIPTDYTGVDEIRNDSKSYNRALTAEAYVYRCVELRSTAIASAPLRIYQTSPDSNRLKSISHPAIDVLDLCTPDGDWVGGFAGLPELMRYMLMSLDLHGRVALQFANNGRNNVPTEVYFLLPEAYRPYRSDRGTLGGIELDRGNQMKIQMPLKNIFYFATPNPRDPLSGLSKIAAARNAINLRQAGVASNQWFFKNNQRPDWILSVPGTVTQENADRFHRLIQMQLGGDNARGPLILGSDSKAQLLTMSPKDAEWVQQQKMSLQEIAMTFGVPAPLLNDLEHATLANVDAYQRQLWHHTMVPAMNTIAAALTRGFLYKFWPQAKANKLAFGFDYSKVEGLSEDINKIWERIMSAEAHLLQQVQGRMMTPNQARQELVFLCEQLGVPATPYEGKVPGGDTFYLRFQDIPIEQASLQAVIDANASRAAGAAVMEDAPGAPSVGDDAANAPAPAPPSPPQRGKAQRIKGPNPVKVRDARLAEIQTKITRRYKRFFQDLKSQALRKLRAQKADDFGPPDDNVYWDRLNAQNDAAAIGKEAISASGQAAYAAAAEDYGINVSWDVTNPWLEQHYGKRLDMIKGVEQSALDRLKSSLSEGAAAGESIDDLTARVSSVLQDALDWESERIARTETIQAYASASLAAYRDGGIEKAEIYDGSDDPECAAVNGEIFDLEEAQSLMDQEHPNGTRGVSPVLTLLEDGTEAEEKSAFAHLSAELRLIKTALAQPKAEPLDIGAIVKSVIESVMTNLPQQPDIKIDMPAPPPVNVNIHEGAVRVDVSPPNLTIAEGAIQSHTPVNVEPQGPSGDLKIAYDANGRVTGTRRVKPGDRN